MRLHSFGLIAGSGLAAVALFGGDARASTFDVTIGSASLSGSPAVLVFDFIGVPPTNTVRLSALTSDGTQGPVPPSITNDVTGTGPWIFGDTSFFNELQVPYSAMGSKLSFSFSTTDNPPTGSFPDGFSFLIYDTTVTTPLITTDDPTGANALFLFSIGPGAPGLSLYNPVPAQTGFSISVAPAQAPEPASLALLAAGLVALSARKRLCRSRTASSSRRGNSALGGDMQQLTSWKPASAGSLHFSRPPMRAMR